MKKIVLGSFLFLVLIGSAHSADVCFMMYYPDDKMENECVVVENAGNLFEAIKATQFDLVWSKESDYGPMLCKINGIGDDLQENGRYCQYKNKSWSFSFIRDKKWQHSPVGFSGGEKCWNRIPASADIEDEHFCVQDGDLIALMYEHEKHSGIPPVLKISEFKVVVDGNEIPYFDMNSEEIKGRTIEGLSPGSEVKLMISVKNFNEKIYINNITITGVIENVVDGASIKKEVEKKDLFPVGVVLSELDFQIPSTLSATRYNLLVKIAGTDNYGVQYSQDTGISLEIKNPE